MYDDTRAADQVDRVNDVGGYVWTELGYRRMQPAWALPKLLWLLGEHPDLAGRARLPHQNDVINQRLVGHPVPTDLSNALKTGAHLIDETLAPRGLRRAGRPPAGAAGPRPVRHRNRHRQRRRGRGHRHPRRHPGHLRSHRRLRRPARRRCADVGSWNSVLGTTLILKGVTRDLIQDPLGAVYSHKAPNGDWLPGGASSTGAGVISRDFPGTDLDALNQAASTHEPAVGSHLPAGLQRGTVPVRRARRPRLHPRRTGRRRATGSPPSCKASAFIERLCFDYLHLLGRPHRRSPDPHRRRHQEPLLVPAAGGHPRPPGDPAGQRRTRPRDGRARRIPRPAAADVAAEMVRVRARHRPAPGHGRHATTPPTSALITELEQRGWLDSHAADTRPRKDQPDDLPGPRPPRRNRLARRKPLRRLQRHRPDHPAGWTRRRSSPSGPAPPASTASGPPPSAAPRSPPRPAPTSAAPPCTSTPDSANWTSATRKDSPPRKWPTGSPTRWPRSAPTPSPTTSPAGKTRSRPRTGSSPRCTTSRPSTPPAGS